MSDAFVVTPATDARVLALFDDETTALLLDHPWAIVEAGGRWLFVSRNVSAAVGPRTEAKPHGLLSRESAAELLVLAERLAVHLLGRV